MAVTEKEKMDRMIRILHGKRQVGDRTREQIEVHLQKEQKALGEIFQVFYPDRPLPGGNNEVNFSTLTTADKNKTVAALSAQQQDLVQAQVDNIHIARANRIAKSLKRCVGFLENAQGAAKQNFDRLGEEAKLKELEQVAKPLETKLAALKNASDIITTLNTEIARANVTPVEIKTAINTALRAAAKIAEDERKDLIKILEEYQTKNNAYIISNNKFVNLAPGGAPPTLTAQSDALYNSIYAGVAPADVNPWITEKSFKEAKEQIDKLYLLAEKKAISALAAAITVLEAQPPTPALTKQIDKLKVEQAKPAKNWLTIQNLLTNGIIEGRTARTAAAEAAHLQTIKNQFSLPNEEDKSKIAQKKLELSLRLALHIAPNDDIKNAINARLESLGATNKNPLADYAAAQIEWNETFSGMIPIPVLLTEATLRTLCDNDFEPRLQALRTAIGNAKITLEHDDKKAEIEQLAKTHKDAYSQKISATQTEIDGKKETVKEQVELLRTAKRAIDSNPVLTELTIQEEQQKKEVDKYTSIFNLMKSYHDNIIPATLPTTLFQAITIENAVKIGANLNLDLDLVTFQMAKNELQSLFALASANQKIRIKNIIDTTFSDANENIVKQNQALYILDLRVLLKEIEYNLENIGASPALEARKNEIIAKLVSLQVPPNDQISLTFAQAQQQNAAFVAPRKTGNQLLQDIPNENKRIQKPIELSRNTRHFRENETEFRAIAAVGFADVRAKKTTAENKLQATKTEIQLNRQTVAEKIQAAFKAVENAAEALQNANPPTPALRQTLQTRLTELLTLSQKDPNILNLSAAIRDEFKQLEEDGLIEKGPAGKYIVNNQFASLDTLTGGQFEKLYFETSDHLNKAIIFHNSLLDEKGFFKKILEKTSKDKDLGPDHPVSQLRKAAGAACASTNDYEKLVEEWNLTTEEKTEFNKQINAKILNILKPEHWTLLATIVGDGSKGDKLKELWEEGNPLKPLPLSEFIAKIQKDDNHIFGPKLVDPKAINERKARLIDFEQTFNKMRFTYPAFNDELRDYLFKRTLNDPEHAWYFEYKQEVYSQRQPWLQRIEEENRKNLPEQERTKVLYIEERLHLYDPNNPSRTIKVLGMPTKDLQDTIKSVCEQFKQANPCDAEIAKDISVKEGQFIFKMTDPPGLDLMVKQEGNKIIVDKIVKGQDGKYTTQALSMTGDNPEFNKVMDYILAATMREALMKQNAILFDGSEGNRYHEALKNMAAEPDPNDPTKKKYPGLAEKLHKIENTKTIVRTQTPAKAETTPSAQTPGAGKKSS